MEKESCTKFCGVLLSSHEVMKFRKFESGVSVVIPVNVQKYYPWFAVHIFVNFIEKELFL